jgi:hypothetical protein
MIVGTPHARCMSVVMTALEAEPGRVCMYYIPARTNGCVTANETASPVSHATFCVLSLVCTPSLLAPCPPEPYGRGMVSWIDGRNGTVVRARIYDIAHN